MKVKLLVNDGIESFSITFLLQKLACEPVSKRHRIVIDWFACGAIARKVGISVWLLLLLDSIDERATFSSLKVALFGGQKCNAG